MTEHNTTAEQRATRGLAGLALWTLAWLVSLALVRFAPDLWGALAVVTWIAVAVNAVVGIGWIVAHARYLKAVDELPRKIMVEAMAVALGVGVVGGFAYSAATHAGVVTFDLDIGILSMIMALVYALASVVGTLRYR